MAHIQCTSVAAEHPTLISILRFLGISTFKDTLQLLAEELCLALHQVLTPTWTGLYTGRSDGEHLCLDMVLTLFFLHKVQRRSAVLDIHVLRW